MIQYSESNRDKLQGPQSLRISPLYWQLTYHHQDVKCSHLYPQGWAQEQLQAEEGEAFKTRHDHFPHARGLLNC